MQAVIGRRYAIEIAIALGIAALVIAALHGVSRFWVTPDGRLAVDTCVVFVGLLGPIFLGLLLAVYQGGVLADTLELAPLRYLGRISYGLYLYHWPVFLLTDTYGASVGLVGASGIFFKFGLTLAIAAISYHALERPLLRLHKDTTSAVPA